jgi:hypothetical protein
MLSVLILSFFMLNVLMPSVLMMREAGIESLGLYAFVKKSQHPKSKNKQQKLKYNF